MYRIENNQLVVGSCDTCLHLGFVKRSPNYQLRIPFCAKRYIEVLVPGPIACAAATTGCSDHEECSAHDKAERMARYDY